MCICTMYMNKKQHSMFLIDHYKVYLFFPHNLILNNQYILLHNLSMYFIAIPAEYYLQPQRLCARNLLKVCIVAGAWRRKKRRIQQHFQKTFWFDCLFWL